VALSDGEAMAQAGKVDTGICLRYDTDFLLRIVCRKTDTYRVGEDIKMDLSPCGSAQE
jgi:hypothetical protein